MQNNVGIINAYYATKHKNMKHHKVWALTLEDLLDRCCTIGCYERQEYTYDHVIDLIDLLTSIQKSLPIGYCIVTTTDSTISTIESILEGGAMLCALFSVLMPPKYYPEFTHNMYYDYVLNEFSMVQSVNAELLSEIYNNRSLFRILRDKAGILNMFINSHCKETYTDRLRDLHERLHRYEVPCYVIHAEQYKNGR